MSAETTLPIETERVTLTVADGTQMPAYVARPKGGGNGRGLLVFQEAFGVNAHIRDVTERFAREGYTAIAPALFHRTGGDFEGSYGDFPAVMPHMQALTNDGITADVQAAYAYLTGTGDATANGVFSVGYCLGGRVSFLADLVLPLKASASYYGGGIAPNPANGAAGLLDRAGELHAPILLIWGGKDTHIGTAATRAVDDALTAAGKPYATITFSEADHGFFCDARPAYNPQAAAQAWPLTLAWFDSNAG